MKKIIEYVRGVTKKTLRLLKKVYKHLGKKTYQRIGMSALGILLIATGVGIIWFASIDIPDLSSFDQRILGGSTKIYDKTGNVLLYDLGQNVRRTVVPLDQISDNIKKATIAIEDEEFYTHNGFRLKSFLRAVIVNITEGAYSQGGSTITQQVVKNSLLKKDKTITRKLKEIILALKLEKVFTKDQILSLYLNESPYGGTIYGVEEASETFFGKKASEVTLTEAAYLAALPQAPSLYLKDRTKLDTRKDLVLLKMLEQSFITKAEYDSAINQKVEWNKEPVGGIKAPHFVMYIKSYLEDKYGERTIEEGGLKVTTTIDYNMQAKAEEIVQKYALENGKLYHATNAALVTLDSKTGQILTMVGSRNFFDEGIEGQYNIATAKRQPGSSFKPFVYALAMSIGYRPETVLFDVQTQFSTSCPPESTSDTDGCYSPENYDGRFRGPMTLRNALAQSINVPAVKLLYLVGIENAIELAQKMGITTITDPKRYGLSLVLGGGEVTLLDMVGAYSVFSNEGEKVPVTGILKVEDKSGKVLEEWEEKKTRVLDRNVALTISSILSDDTARAPVFGSHGSLYYAGRDVAAKTGTTNNYRDTWVVGYTPQVTIGAWSGNNDNSPIDKKVAGYIVAPMWHAFFNEVLKELPDEKFAKPELSPLDSVPPAIRGVYQDSSGIPHSILYFINKENPLGGGTTNPYSDPQFSHWEYSVQKWAGLQSTTTTDIIPGTSGGSTIRGSFTSPENGEVFKGSRSISFEVKIVSDKKISKVDYFINGTYVKSESSGDFSTRITGNNPNIEVGINTVTASVTDSAGNVAQFSTTFTHEK